MSAPADTLRRQMPPERQETLRRAIRLEWWSLVFLAVTIAVMALVVGSSQAMRAAWIEDMLSLAPPLAFLVSTHVMRRLPTKKYPYGFFRSVGVGHLVAGVALFGMGAFLIVESLSTLLRGERPPIGSVVLFGQSVWLGWLMITVMALTIPLPIWFGRVKMRLAQELHDKVLYADADMNKADWQTAVGSIVGVLGIGLGLWWMDAAAAIFIAAGIVRDGVKNTRAAVTDLMDTRATTFDDERPHPDVAKVHDYLSALPWVEDVRTRTRDQGMFFHIEAFVIPRRRRMPSLARLERAREGARRIDWKMHDVVVVPVAEFPDSASERP
ncbi:cation transporter [Microbacterium sp. NPDC091313]